MLYIIYQDHLYNRFAAKLYSAYCKKENKVLPINAVDPLSINEDDLLVLIGLTRRNPLVSITKNPLIIFNSYLPTKKTTTNMLGDSIIIYGYNEADQKYISTPRLVANYLGIGYMGLTNGMYLYSLESLLVGLEYFTGELKDNQVIYNYLVQSYYKPLNSKLDKNHNLTVIDDSDDNLKKPYPDSLLFKDQGFAYAMFPEDPDYLYTRTIPGANQNDVLMTIKTGIKKKSIIKYVVLNEEALPAFREWLKAHKFSGKTDNLTGYALSPINWSALTQI